MCVLGHVSCIFIFLDGTILLSGTVNAKSLFLSGYVQEEGEGAVGCGYRLTSAPGCTGVHVMKSSLGWRERT